MNPKTKIVAVVDHAKAQKHTWQITVLNGSHPVTSKGYGEDQKFFALMESGHEAAGHDLYQLRKEAEMTEAEFRFLRETEFDAIEHGETYEVSD